MITLVLHRQIRSLPHLMPSQKPSESFSQDAIWTPGWYELDQTLVLGVRQKLKFFETLPAELTQTEDTSWVFFNGPNATENCVTRFAFVDQMLHPVMGELLRIDTDGLDYIFFPVNGHEVVVNAEEEPGSIYDGAGPITDWSVRVKLSDVSERIDNLV